MKFSAQVAGVSALVVLAGCTCAAPERRIYSATLERVSEPYGEFESPVKGHTPLFCLYLHLVEGPEYGGLAVLKVSVQDLYSPGIYGREGDRVLFGFVGDLPAVGAVEFESLAGYRVLSRKG